MTSNIEERGTCVAAALSTSRMAVAVDSLVTLTNSNGMRVGSQTGCKIARPQPSVILIAVGIADSTIGPDHWNALDTAASLLKTVKIEDVSSLDPWSRTWWNILVGHYRSHGFVPTNPGIVSEMLLLTRINGQPLQYKVITSWDGKIFSMHSIFSILTDQGGSTYFSGACESFVSGTMSDGRWHPRPRFLTSLENIELDSFQSQAVNAGSVDAQEKIVLRYESVFTSIDARIEGTGKVIGPPYAVAVWEDGQKEWTTKFNTECADTTASHAAIGVDR